LIKILFECQDKKYQNLQKLNDMQTTASGRTINYRHGDSPFSHTNKEFWRRGTGLDFTPEGWCLPIGNQWNNGTVLTFVPHLITTGITMRPI
jgi:hypothetical protein